MTKLILFVVCFKFDFSCFQHDVISLDYVSGKALYLTLSMHGMYLPSSQRSFIACWWMEIVFCNTEMPCFLCKLDCHELIIVDRSLCCMNKWLLLLIMYQWWIFVSSVLSWACHLNNAIQAPTISVPKLIYSLYLIDDQVSWFLLC